MAEAAGADVAADVVAVVALVVVVAVTLAMAGVAVAVMATTTTTSVIYGPRKDRADFMTRRGDADISMAGVEVAGDTVGAVGALAVEEALDLLGGQSRIKVPSGL